MFSLFLICAFLFTSCVSEAEPTFVAPASAPSPTPFQPDPDEFDSPFQPDLPTIAPVSTDENGIPLEESRFATPTSMVSVFPILNLSPDINPLTGLPPANPALLERRPMAIKVTNYPRYVRPQAGLTLADQVFEYYIEDRLTRFIAVMYGNDSEWVGPVRSGRYFDEHVARMFSAFLVFKYADPREYTHLGKSVIADYLVVPSNGACPPFRISHHDRDTYNNIFFNTILFKDCIAKREGVDNARQPIRNGFFSELIPNSDYAVRRIYTQYSNDDYHYWEYDPGALKYFRWQETVSVKPSEGVTEAYAPLMDEVTGRQVDAQNIIILFVEHTFANQFDAEDEVYQINLTGSGRAYVFRDGIAVPATWQRPDMDQPLFLATPEGSPIFLRPGRTFYEVIGVSSTYYQDENGWYFAFRTP
ncbi:MAG: hypothetical protein HFACDABA_01919 [Anaerolineales bacterium]|nr:hypothetical protein [Anaerolineales bacterium]